jgi:hypothetical protein
VPDVFVDNAVVHTKLVRRAVALLTARHQARVHTWCSRVCASMALQMLRQEEGASADMAHVCAMVFGVVRYKLGPLAVGNVAAMFARVALGVGLLVGLESTCTQKSHATFWEVASGGVKVGEQ